MKAAGITLKIVETTKQNGRGTWARRLHVVKWFVTQTNRLQGRRPNCTRTRRCQFVRRHSCIGVTSSRQRCTLKDKRALISLCSLSGLHVKVKRLKFSSPARVVSLPTYDNGCRISATVHVLICRTSSSRWLIYSLDYDEQANMSYSCIMQDVDYTVKTYGQKWSLSEDALAHLGGAAIREMHPHAD